MVRKCIVCGKEFDTMGKAQKYCSKECGGRVSLRIVRDRKPREKECEICGKTFSAKTGAQKYCSRECGESVAKNQRREYYELHKDELSDYQKRYRESHSDLMKEYRKNYYRSNRGRFLKNPKKQVSKRRGSKSDEFDWETKRSESRDRKWNREVDQSAEIASIKPRKCGFDGPCFECPFPDCKY